MAGSFLTARRSYSYKSPNARKLTATKDRSGSACRRITQRLRRVHIKGTLNGLAKTIWPLSSGRKQFRYLFGRIKRT